MNFSKMTFLIRISCVTLLLLSCKSSEQTQKLPQCIESQIETLKNQSVQNPPSEVWQWESKGKTFYYFNAVCCDQFTILYNDKCEIICAPDGGFTGKGDGKCPDFGSDTKRTLLWKDDRKS